MPARTVAELAAWVGGSVVGDPGVEVSDVVHDSRMAGSGKLFVAVRGAGHDGHDYVGQAIAAGSPVVCVSHVMDVGATQLVVSDPRSVMGLIADSVHGHPSGSVPVVGVTGTNGKTTVTHFIESIATRAGLAAGLVGTICTRLAGVDMGGSGRTTPEATDFQRLLARMRDAGAEVIATEVSSHALALDRVRGTSFAVAAFTNLSQDHLDFHGDMGAYRLAKESLFREYDVAVAVLNVDDPVGRDIASSVEMPKLTVGAEGNYLVDDVVESLMGSSFDFNARGRVTRVETSVIGRFNVHNLLLAAVCCIALGLEENVVVEAMGHLPGVPGRFELVSGDSPVRVVVDYAHTPEAISRAIEVARRVTEGRVIAVIGAGGDRDEGKRAPMGRAAAFADLVVITSDNPRSEDPAGIAAALAAGIGDHTPVIHQPDRRSAISEALEASHPGDLVLVMGKGHETTQEAGGVVVPFNDAETVRDLLGVDRYPGPGPTSGSMSA